MKLLKIYNHKYDNNLMFSKKQNIMQDKINKSFGLVDLSSDAIKSKYCPSFGSFTKVANLSLKDKETGASVFATLNKDRYSNYIIYKVMIGRQEAGMLEMYTKQLFPEGDYVLTEPDNCIPKIAGICAFMSDKYTGIGTELVKAAVNESKQCGNGGCLFLMTEKGYGKTLSDNIRSDNPIPFFYKMGFESPDSRMDNHIKDCIESGNYRNLPNSTLLLLTRETVSNNPIYN